VVDERGDVGGHERLALADPHHQRRRATRGHDLVGTLRMGEHQRERALEPGEHRADGDGETARAATLPPGVVEGPGDEVGADLGVGVARELHPVGLELGAQRSEVLDDPVVHHGHPAGGVAVRMRVAVGGRAVRRPAGVAHADVGVVARGSVLGGVVGEDRNEVVQRPCRAVHLERLGAVGVHDRHPRRVVPPVLEAAQTADEDVPGRAPTDVSHDSAHDARG